MSENSKIEWTHHTFNPWRGCTKVSAGCANCYAETMSKRNPTALGVWGDNGVRAMAAESYWKQPVKWNRDAESAGERRRVFCASLADVCEDRKELIEPRTRLKGLIEATPHLDWLLLTKRPENYLRLFYGPDCWPDNVWAGTSVEDQAATTRIEALLKVTTRYRFLSCEPLIGPLQLKPEWLELELRAFGAGTHFFPRIDWIIVGGESGAGARPMHPDWAKSLRDQCTASSVRFFFKQWGEFAPVPQNDVQPGPPSVPLVNLKRSVVLRVDGDRSIYMPHSSRPDAQWMIPCGKQASGRLLDGREWNEFPSVQS